MRLSGGLKAARTGLQRLALPAAFYAGEGRECPVCEGRFRRFRPYGRRPEARCPRCDCFERHRLLWLYLTRETELLASSWRVLHFAPEKGISRRLDRLDRLERLAEYVTTDIEPGAAEIEADITDLPFADGAFDLVLCQHVLEHVPDDRRAMKELARVLAPGGFAVLQHPIDHELTETYEDPSITSPREREREFLQHDHVRLYGRDLADRLEATGLAVQFVPYAAALTGEERERMGIQDPSRSLRGDDVFVCEKA